MGLEQKGFVAQVKYQSNMDTEQLDYTYHFITTAENAEQALSKGNRHLLRNKNFEKFPDAFFASLSLVRDYASWAAKPAPYLVT